MARVNHISVEIEAQFGSAFQEETALRMLTIDLSGSSIEMWRLSPTERLPSTQLTVSAQGEVVMSLGMGVR